ncbi:hypothetical protein V6B71_03450 [Mediterraneibacter gnavus]|uniref:acyltransferase n=1 Tax=Mediterraneibacter gnavus TaxID=33038 RepID=UPI001185A686|nr:hypothetical protein [Mediterraneibacter gnavus]
MKGLIWIPIVILYILFFLFAVGLLLCSFYARYSKRRSSVNIDQSTLNKANRVDMENGHMRTESVQAMKRSKIRSVAKAINLYLYGLCRYYSILIGRLPSQRVRNFLMRTVFRMDISPKAVLYGGFEIRSPWNIHIGKSVIGVGALLDGRSGIRIEDRVCLAQNVKLFTLQHDVNNPHFAAVGGRITLEEYSWISSGTTVLPGGYC